MPTNAKVESQLSTKRTTLDQRTLWQRVHEHLRDESISGRLTRDTELHEVALARSLGVSRGPIREALGTILWAARTGDVERAVRLTSDHIRVPQIQLLLEDHELASADGRSR